MLVLSRKLGEKIKIGQDITITVVEIKGNKIRIGIDAPQEVPVFRAELHGFQESAAITPLEPPCQSSP